MGIYKIHPIVMGTKVFDKGMMTYQHDYGKPYTIPIYCWYLEGGKQKTPASASSGKTSRHRPRCAPWSLR